MAETAEIEIKRPVPVQPQTFKVTAEGVTWEQYKRILTICPLAEAEKESD